MDFNEMFEIVKKTDFDKRMKSQKPLMKNGLRRKVISKRKIDASREPFKSRDSSLDSPPATQATASTSRAVQPNCYCGLPAVQGSFKKRACHRCGKSKCDYIEFAEPLNCYCGLPAKAATFKKRPCYTCGKNQCNFIEFSGPLPLKDEEPAAKKSRKEEDSANDISAEISGEEKTMKQIYKTAMGITRFCAIVASRLYLITDKRAQEDAKEKIFNILDN